MDSNELEKFKQRFYRSGNFYVDITDKRPSYAYADEYKKIIGKYNQRITSINSFLEYLLKTLSTNDIKEESLFLYPFGKEQELDTNYTYLIPWDCCIKFVNNNYDEASRKENTESNFKQFFSIIIKHYDLYNDFLKTRYDEFKKFYVEFLNDTSNANSSEPAFSYDEVNDNEGLIALRIEKTESGVIKLIFPNLNFIKKLNLNNSDLSVLFNDELYESLPKDQKNSVDFFKFMFGTVFEKKAFLEFTLYLIESKLIEEKQLSFFYKNRVLGIWFIQDRIKALYDLKMYSLIVSFFDNCKSLISPYSILSNDSNILVWPAFYFDSLLKLNPENKISIKKEIIKYYRRIYRILLFIQGGMEFNDLDKNLVDFEMELKKLLPNDANAFENATIPFSSNQHSHLKTINANTVDVSEITSVLTNISSMFPDIFDEAIIEILKEDEEKSFSKDKVIKEQDDKIKTLEKAYNDLNKDFIELKENRENLSEVEFNKGLYQLLDDLPPSEPGRNTFEFEGVGKKDIPSEIWESFTPNTQNSIRAAFTLVNQANLPIDLAVLSILRCIEIEFISKFTSLTVF